MDKSTGERIIPSCYDGLINNNINLNNSPPSPKGRGFFKINLKVSPLSDMPSSQHYDNLLIWCGVSPLYVTHPFSDSNFLRRRNIYRIGVLLHTVWLRRVHQVGHDMGSNPYTPSNFSFLYHDNPSFLFLRSLRFNGSEKDN